MASLKQLDPWSSFEVKDYSKIMKNFGVSKLQSRKLPTPHHYFSRKIIFGEKSMAPVYKAIATKKPFVMMTGLMPSGKFHFGHKIIADLMVYFQKLGAECYVCVADIESYLTRGISLDEAKKIAQEEYLANYIALGLQPKKTRFYLQSEGPKPYQTLSKIVPKKTTFNEMRSIYGTLTPEKMVSVFTQVADILHPQLDEFGGPRPTVVPVGVDQLGHISLTRDIASRMKSEFKFVPPSAIFTKLMPGLKGGKLSSSDPTTAIFLSDNPEDVARKVRKYAFSGGRPTLKEHREKGGNPDVDASYQWLMYLEENDKELQKTREDYISGSLLSGELKQVLIDKLTFFLRDHQKKMVKARKKVDKLKFVG